MGKIFKIILSLILVIVLAAVGVGVYVFIQINDSTNNTLESVKQNDYPLMYVINREADESTKNIDTTNKVSFSLNEENLNEVLYAVVKDLSVPSVSIKGAYAEFVEGGMINVEVPLAAYGINSCLKAKLKIEDNNGDFVLKLNNAKVGKFDATNSIIRNFVLKNLSAKQLVKDLEEKKIYCDISFDDLSLTFTKENIIKTLKERKSEDKNVGLYSVLIDFLLSHQDILNFELGNNNTVGFDFDISNMLYDQSRDDAIRYPIDLASCKASTLSTEGLDYKNVSPLFGYYVNGYDSLSDKEKTEIEPLNLSKTYKGRKEIIRKVTMAEIIESQTGESRLAEVLLNKELSINITEDDFAAIFANLDFIGKSFAFGVDNTSLAYLTFESLSLDIKDNAFYINMIMNVSGKRVILKAYCTSPKSNETKITATLTDIKFGTVQFDNKYIPSVLEYLKGVLEKETWIIVNPDDSTITIDVGSIVANSNLFSKIESVNKNNSVEFKDAASGNGELKLIYSLSE